MKSIQNIVLEVPTAQAQRFQQLTAEQKKVLSTFVTDFLTDDKFDLKSIMDFMGFRAQQRGLTPEILEEILNEELV